TYLYSPKTVEESGSLFYIVQRNMNTGKLITFLARHYRPVLNKVSRLISCKQTPSGGELVFMLLFPSYDIKGPHITFVSVDLHKFKIMDLNITVELSEDQHQQCIDDDVCSFDISRVHDATGADYILCNINGLFMGYSLNTGSLIMSPTNEDFVGLKLDPRYSTMTPASHIVVASFRGQFMVIQCPKVMPIYSHCNTQFL
uniref:Uncharacterized protein LOC102804130 n=1 Tax=Saccoglossus kowalevskii TaxID=10224 RepID=A0ABM0MD73_SACKO